MEPLLATRATRLVCRFDEIPHEERLRELDLPPPLHLPPASFWAWSEGGCRTDWGLFWGPACMTGVTTKIHALLYNGTMGYKRNVILTLQKDLQAAVASKCSIENFSRSQILLENFIGCKDLARTQLSPLTVKFAGKI